MEKKYYEELDKQNIEKIRKLQEELPSFCKSFFHDIADYTSTRTRVAYAYDLKVFFDFLQENNSECRKTDIRELPLSVLDSITKDDILEYLDHMTLYDKDGRTITNKERGKARKISSLRSFYNYFYRNEKIEKNPASLIPVPKQHEKEIIRLEPQEVAILLDQVEAGTKLTKSQLKYHKINKVRDVAILTLLLGTGIRVSECVGLNINDVDVDNGALVVHRKGGYNATIYFGFEVETALRDYLEQREEMTPLSGHEDALFLSIQNKRMGVRSVENMVKKYAQNVTTLKKITPHKLRSTYGTSLYKETGDIYLVASVLGHSDVNTTRKHYAAISDEQRKTVTNAVKLRSGE